MTKANEESYIRNTKAQYEALGRFVEAFESMVEETRASSIDILAQDEGHRKLVNVSLHHSALSAKPLFEIMRALFAELLKRPDLNLETKDRETFSGVLSDIAGEYSVLTNVRNNLLHGTWYIGYSSSDDRKLWDFHRQQI